MNAAKLDTSGLDPITGKPFVDTSTGGSKGILGDTLDFANKNKTVTLGLMQAGGSFLKGFTDTLTPAQIAYYNANAANNQAQANLTTLQTQNLAQPKATALPPVTGSSRPWRETSAQHEVRRRVIQGRRCVACWPC